MASTINPIQFPEQWMRYRVGLVACPGIIAKDGIQGFERETAWDLKKGKGIKGGTLTLMQRPPAKGSIKTWLWKPEHWPEWDQFRPLLNYDPDKEPAQALDIYHPALAANDIDAVVVKNIGPPIHHGGGLYSITVHFIEFAPPPPVDATSTPTTASATEDPNAVGELPDLAVVTEQVLMSSLMAQANP